MSGLSKACFIQHIYIVTYFEIFLLFTAVLKNGLYLIRGYEVTSMLFENILKAGMDVWKN